MLMESKKQRYDRDGLLRLSSELFSAYFMIFLPKDIQITLYNHERQITYFIKNTSQPYVVLSFDAYVYRTWA